MEDAGRAILNVNRLLSARDYRRIDRKIEKGAATDRATLATHP